MSILSRNLKLLRLEAGLSIYELSEKLNVTEEEILAWERGISEPNDYILAKACRFLKMPLEDIKDRDMELERKEALRTMKAGKTRTNYNWYFGNRKKFAFYLSYLIYTIVGLIFVFFIAQMAIKSPEFLERIQSLPPSEAAIELRYYYLSTLLTTYSIFSIGAAGFMIAEVVMRKMFIFRWWYLFFISFIISIGYLFVMLFAIPYAVIMCYRLIKKKY